jgi:hypothetical protein
MQNHEQRTKVKKSEEPRFYGQNKLFFEHPALQPLAVSATWLHVGAPQKIQELNTHFQQKFTTGSDGIGI